MNPEECFIKTDRNMRELQTHGTLSFPCGIYSTDPDSLSGEVVPWHLHDEIEIIHLRKGAATLQLPGREENIIEGTTCIINSNTLHYITGERGYKLESFVFSPLLISGGSDTVFYRKYIEPVISNPSITLYITEDEDSSRLFSEAYKAAEEEKDGWEFTLRENLTSLFLSLRRAYLSSTAPSPSPITRDTERTEKILRYMEKHYAEPLSLPDIADEISLSVRETLRCFKRTTGEPPISYLLKYRLMKSADLLRDSPSLQIGDVALRSGFDSPGYYSKEFKRYYKCTPGEYRRLSKR